MTKERAVAACLPCIDEIMILPFVQGEKEKAESIKITLECLRDYPRPYATPFEEKSVKAARELLRLALEVQGKTRQDFVFMACHVLETLISFHLEGL